MPSPTSLSVTHPPLKPSIAGRLRYDGPRSIVLSTNKPFAEWSEGFPHAACAVTLIDRLLHRAEIIDIEGDSYRLKEAKERAATKSAIRAKKRA